MAALEFAGESGVDTVTRSCSAGKATLQVRVLGSFAVLRHQTSAAAAALEEDASPARLSCRHRPCAQPRPALRHVLARPGRSARRVAVELEPPAAARRRTRLPPDHRRPRERQHRPHPCQRRPVVPAQRCPQRPRCRCHRRVAQGCRGARGRFPRGSRASRLPGVSELVHRGARGGATAARAAACGTGRPSRGRARSSPAARARA